MKQVLFYYTRIYCPIPTLAVILTRYTFVYLHISEFSTRHPLFQGISFWIWFKYSKFMLFCECSPMYTSIVILTFACPQMTWLPYSMRTSSPTSIVFVANRHTRGMPLTKTTFGAALCAFPPSRTIGPLAEPFPLAFTLNCNKTTRGWVS